MDIQKRIDQFVKHMPDGRIQFMGYVWPAELITPDYDFHEVRHPTIIQCLEYIMGVNLSFYFNGPPKAEINQEEVGHHISYIMSWANIDRGKDLIVKQVNNTSLWDEFLNFDELAFQIYDDIVKDIHIGELPAGKNGTIPRESFLQWLNGYLDSKLDDNLERVLAYLLCRNQDDIHTEKVISLLKENNLDYNYNAMPKTTREPTVNELYKRGLRPRMIALILDWRRIESGKIKLESAVTNINRMLGKKKT